LPSNTFIESERLSLAFEKLITHTIFLNPAAASFIVAIRLRALQRNHDLNIECHTAQVIGQSIEEVALPLRRRKSANERAILGIGQRLFELCL
jgi:hypothetical protein